MHSLLLIFCQAFAEESENIFRDSDRRSDLDKAYKMLSQRLFNEVARIASEHLKTPRHVIMLENFHRINGLLFLYLWLAKQHTLHLRRLFICFMTSQIRRTPPHTQITRISSSCTIMEIECFQSLYLFNTIVIETVKIPMQKFHMCENATSQNRAGILVALWFTGARNVCREHLIPKIAFP